MPRADVTKMPSGKLYPLWKQGGKKGPHLGGSGSGNRLAHRIHPGGHCPDGAVRHGIRGILSAAPRP